MELNENDMEQMAMLYCPFAIMTSFEHPTLQVTRENIRSIASGKKCSKEIVASG